MGKVVSINEFLRGRDLEQFALECRTDYLEEKMYYTDDMLQNEGWFRSQFFKECADLAGLENKEKIKFYKMVYK